MKQADLEATEFIRQTLFMQAVGIPNAHLSGLSLGAASGMWLAAKYPSRVKSLSVHSGWVNADSFLKTLVEGWQVTTKALGSVPEMVILSIFPWCFTPELYAAKPEYPVLGRICAGPASAASDEFPPGIECRHRA